MRAGVARVLRAAVGWSARAFGALQAAAASAASTAGRMEAISSGCGLGASW